MSSQSSITSTRRAPTYYVMTSVWSGPNGASEQMLLIANKRDGLLEAANRLIAGASGSLDTIQKQTADRNAYVVTYSQLRKRYSDERIYEMQYDAISPDDVDDAIESLKAGRYDDDDDDEITADEIMADVATIERHLGR
jgi:hypothetical protein